MLRDFSLTALRLQSSRLSALFLEDYLVHGEGKRVLNIYLPVKRLEMTFRQESVSRTNVVVIGVRLWHQGGWLLGRVAVVIRLGSKGGGLARAVYRLHLLKVTPFIFIFLVLINQKPRLVIHHNIYSEKCLSEKVFDNYNFKN